MKQACLADTSWVNRLTRSGLQAPVLPLTVDGCLPTPTYSMLSLSLADLSEKMKCRALLVQRVRFYHAGISGKLQVDGWVGLI